MDEIQAPDAKWLSPPQSLNRIVLRYSLAIVSVAVAIVVGLLAHHYGIGHQFAMLLFAIAVAGWTGGLGPAIVAAVIASLAYDCFITEPLYSLGFTKYDVIDLGFYLLFAFLITRFREIRWRTEGTLRASEQKYREFIDASPDAIFVWDNLCGCADKELIGILTSSNEERDLVRSYKLGVNAYVTKPVDFHEFVNAVKELGVFWAVINEPPPGSLRRP